jgi:transcriptional regulator with XRE-family HTH domain
MEIATKKGRKPKTTNYNNIFAVRLRELIEKKAIVHETMAKGIGVCRQAIGKWANGETVPDVFTAAKLAKYFEVSTDFLVGNTDEPNPNIKIQAIRNITGLSGEAIEILSINNSLALDEIKEYGDNHFGKKSLNILNKMIEQKTNVDTNIFEILNIINLYIDSVLAIKIYKSKEENLEKNITLFSKEYEPLELEMYAREYQAQQVFIRLIRKIAKEEVTKTN